MLTGSIYRYGPMTVLLMLGGCATAQRVEMGSTDIDQAHQEVPEELLLDVGTGGRLGRRPIAVSNSPLNP